MKILVGIKLQTQGMTVERATTLFEVQGHQPRPIAIAEAKRGTSDAVYGYYKMGKVMILKLREDYRVKVGALIVFGSAIADNNRIDAASSEVRAFDVRTGALKWTWDPVPQHRNDPAFNTWHGPNAHRTGAANTWSVLAADAERDLVILPTSSAPVDYWGGQR